MVFSVNLIIPIAHNVEIIDTPKIFNMVSWKYSLNVNPGIMGRSRIILAIRHIIERSIEAMYPYSGGYPSLKKTYANGNAKMLSEPTMI